jgi:hypothetical protein
MLGLGILAALPSPPLEGQTACREGVVASVEVVNHSIFDPDDAARATRFRWAHQLANTLHVRTREDFIRSELLLEPGECYDPFLLAESERLLRRYRFIARAAVSGARRPDGDWDLRVETQDEWTTRVSVRGTTTGGLQVERVGVTEQNLFGAGILLGGAVTTLDGRREPAVRMELPRLAGTRWDAALRWSRDGDGGDRAESLSYPFLGEVGRFAASETFMRRETWFGYSAGSDGDARPGTVTALFLPYEQDLVEVTIAGRLGTPGNLTVFGIGFSNETLGFPAFPGGLEVAVDGGLERDAADSTVADDVRHQTTHSAGTHLNLMVAQRNVRFEQFRGLDALRGTTDVPLGVQLSLLLGRRVGTLSADTRQPDDLAVGMRAEWAAAPGPLLVIGSSGVDARRIFAGGEAGQAWTDVLAESAVLLYWQPPDRQRHTFFVRAEGVGGWSVSQPFQLTLGGPAGVRGYDIEDFPGGRRVVINAEDRIYLGWPFPSLLDLGVTVLGDLGWMWAGDAPFGVDSGWRGTVGGGLRVGFPAGSGRVARLDVAWPVSPAGIRRSPKLRLSIVDPIGISAGLSDRQLARTRVNVGPDRFTDHLR